MKLFDVRTLRATGSVSFEAGPAHARLHRGQPGTALVCSSEGYVEVLDVWSGQRHAGFQASPAAIRAPAELTLPHGSWTTPPPSPR